MSKLIDQAFGADDDLRRRIQTTIQSVPTTRPLFEDIASYHLRHSNVANGAEISDEPAAKKRKLANGTVPIHQADAKCEQALEIREVSFSIPQRKKLHFRIVQYTSPDQSTIGVQAVSPASGQVEYELPGAEIAQVLRLPVPEKATKQFNYLFITKPGSSSEPILFTVPATPLKAGTFTLPSPATTLDEALAQILKPHQLTLTLPNENEFSSAVPEAHRKSEKAYHVKAFRGSKDGFLFFLSNGIFFGFKKPLLFLAFEDIESISYTSVLQRTFNLNIAFRKPGGGDDAAEPEEQEEEIEFSMLDQADYAGINEYVQRHGLNDASLAAGRRAKSEVKKKGVANGEVAGDGGEEDDDDDGRTELEKAQQQMEDEEEEDDEDFDPDEDDEDGDASGSGSEDDSEDEAYEVKGKKGKDLVKDELGSEAEDVEITDEEEGDGGDADEEEEEEEEGEEEEGGEEEDVAEGEEDEDMVEAELESKPVAASTQQQQPIVTGRWGAAINNEPDPDDEDQL